MDLHRYGFLVATLGEDGAQVLAKAAERSPVLGAVLVPRAILAWLQLQGADANAPEYEGELPGVRNSYLNFYKTSEGGYSGTISVGANSYGFQDATPIQLAASLGIALGADAEAIQPGLKNIDIQRLGKSIDLLAKARKACQDIAEARLGMPVDGYWLDKAEGPGPAAPPQAQGEPDAPAPPKSVQPRQSAKKPATPKPGKGLSPLKPPTSADPEAAKKPAANIGNSAARPQVKLARSQANIKCPVCGLTQFHGERLVGCLCFQDLAKSATATRTAEGFQLTFGADWDADAIEVFLEGLQGKAHAI